MVYALKREGTQPLRAQEEHAQEDAPPAAPEWRWLKHLKTAEERDAGKAVLDAFDAFRDEYGKPGLERLTQTLATRGTLHPTDIHAVMREVSPRREFQEAVFKELETHGILEWKKQIPVVDLGGIKNLSREKMIAWNAKFDARERYGAYFSYGRPYAFHEAFKDMPVVSKEAWERGERTPKPLFYVPETEEDAFDQKKINAADFCLGFWELSRLQNISELDYPSDRARLKLNEVSLAALVYHPKYGDGYRDDEGKLFVRDPKTRDYERMSGTWITAKMHFKGGRASREKHDYGDTLYAPHEYLERHAPHLVAKGLLTPNDFRAGAFSPAAAEKRVERSKVGHNGAVTIRGVIHYLGKQFRNQPIGIYEIASGIGGITERTKDGKEALQHTFIIRDAGDSSLKTVKMGKGKPRGYAGATLTQVTPYDREAFFERRQGETDEAYKVRIRAIDNFEKVLALSKELWRNAKINLGALPYEEQAMLAEVIGAFDQKTRAELPAFAAQFGLDGVRAFLSAEQDAALGDRVMTLAKELGPPLAREVLHKYCDILDTANRAGEELASAVREEGASLPRDAADTVRAKLVERAKEFLLTLAEDAAREKKKGHAFRLEDILMRLDGMQKDAALFGAIFKTAAKENPQLEFSEFKDLEFATKEIGESLEAKDIAQMISISRANWQDRLGGETVTKEFAEKLTHAERERIPLLRHRGALIGFALFEPRGHGRVHFGSFNIDPRYRGSALGEAMMRKTLDAEAKSNTLEAVVRPELEVSNAYIEKSGFIVVGFVAQDPKTGASYFRIERNDEENGAYASKRRGVVTGEQIVREHVATKDAPFETRIKKGERLVLFLDTDDPQTYALFDRLLNQEGYVITRAIPHMQKKIARYYAFEKRATAPQMQRAA